MRSTDFTMKTAAHGRATDARAGTAAPRATLAQLVTCRPELDDLRVR
jgi:hypothetical protein